MASVNLKSIHLRETLDDGYNGPAGEFIFTLIVNPMPFGGILPGISQVAKTRQLSLRSGGHAINLSCGVSEDWGYPLCVTLHVREVDDVNSDDTLSSSINIYPVSWTIDEFDTTVWLSYRGRTIGHAVIGCKFQGTPAFELKSGDVVALLCQGSSQSTYRFLDGNTETSQVRQLASMDSGSLWDVHLVGSRTPQTQNMNFKCLGRTEGNRWLDGVTLDSSVRLAPHTGDGYSGTHWAAYWDKDVNLPSDRSTTAFRCLGNGANPYNKVWLDGDTSNGHTRLVSHYGGEYSGAFWRAIKISPSARH